MKLAIDMDLYKKIRRLYLVDGMSQRKIAELLHVSRKTITKYCGGGNMPDSKRSVAGIISPLRQAVEPEILKYMEDNKDSTGKQKITAKSIWRWLSKEKGFNIGQSTVRGIVYEIKNERPEAFVPLAFDPGDVMEFDWGDCYCFMDGIKTSVSVFCTVLPYSYGIFVAVFPNKANEAFFMGHIMAFEFFGGVPSRCIYDNLKTAVLSGSGKNAVKQDAFKKLEAHYAFEAVFCNVAAGWEKGAVENLVNVARKIAFTPMPKVKNYLELQEMVTARCLEYCESHKLRGKNKSIGEELSEERGHLLPLPVVAMDVAKTVQVRVNSDLTVFYEGNKYSVPFSLVGQQVTLRVTTFEVIVYFKGEMIYPHKRTYKKNDPQYVPDHYLELLDRKPRAIRDAAPLKNGIMPKELTDFCDKYRGKDKNVQLISILKLAKVVPKEKLLWAVNLANQGGNPNYDLVCFYLDLQNNPVEELKQFFQVDAVDLSGYDALMLGGGE